MNNIYLLMAVAVGIVPGLNVPGLTQGVPNASTAQVQDAATTPGASVAPAKPVAALQAPAPAAAAVAPVTPGHWPADPAGSLTRTLLGAAVSVDSLNSERGKADTVSYEAQLSGVVSGNSATNVATGANTIDTGSFANMAGLPVVIQNTGANVLIQNSTIVNVQFR